MKPSARLLGALLLAVAPTAACGGKTDPETSEYNPNAGVSGSSGQSGAGGSSAGAGGSASGAGGSVAGAAGSVQGGGQGGVSHGGTAGHGGVAGSGGAASSWCVAPTPLLAGGQPTGLYTCQDGRVVRREVLACPVVGPELPGTCSSDADCAAGQLCNCGPAGGECVNAGCATSADCPGQECTFYTKPPVNACLAQSTYGFACTTSADLCDGASCQNNERCAPSGGVAWGCQPYPFCSEGRPLFVESQLRFAGLRSGAWC